MWKTRLAACLLLGAGTLGAGCAETPAVVPVAGRPAPILQPLLAAPISHEKLELDTILLGNVGKPIGRDYYELAVQFSEPTQLSCKVTFRPLAVEAVPATSQVAALNIHLTGPGTDQVDCDEIPLLLSRQLNCAVKKPGRFALTFQSANRALAVVFGFLCTKTPLKVDRSPAPAPPPKPITIKPAHHSHGSPGHAPGPPPSSAGTELPSSTARLIKRIDEVTDGHDDQHKILALVPCTEPLKGLGGKIKIGKSSPRPYVVHKSKTCEVEVGDVRESELAADSQVVLMQ